MAAPALRPDRRERVARELTRREALAGLSAILCAGGCRARRTEPEPERSFGGRILGSDANLGHRIRRGDLPEPTETVERKWVVVGGGCSGLSAAWRLRRAEQMDVELVELAGRLGGATRAGAMRGPILGSKLVDRLCEEARVGTLHRSEPTRVLVDGRWSDDPLTDDYLCRREYGAREADVSREAVERARATLDSAGPAVVPRLIDWLATHPPYQALRRPAYRVLEDGTVDAWDVTRDVSVRYRAERVLVCTPNHVTHVITAGARARFGGHSPWLAARIALSTRPRGSARGQRGVVAASTSVGWVEGHRSWSWFQPWEMPARAALLAADWKTLASRPLADIGRAYPVLRAATQRVDIWRWGHGTLVPTPAVARSQARIDAAKPLGRVHFGHAELSGFPFIEEAFTRGVMAAEEALAAAGVAHEPWPQLRG